jgi:hypothetical protein
MLELLIHLITSLAKAILSFLTQFLELSNFTLHNVPFEESKTVVIENDNKEIYFDKFTITMDSQKSGGVDSTEIKIDPKLIA